MARLLARISMLVVALMFFGGCGKTEKLPTTRQATIKGSVSNGGKSIDMDSTVTFFCAEHDATFGAKIDSLGKFQMVPSLKSVGIPAGRYKVMIRPPEKAAQTVGSNDYTEMMKKTNAANVKPEAPSNIPVSVLSFETTKLVLEVQEGDNVFDIDLSKLPK